MSDTFEKIEVGKEFPDDKYRGTLSDAMIVRLTEGWIDLVIALKHPQPHEVEQIQNQPMRYGYTVFDSCIPFVVLEFPDMSFDASLTSVDIPEADLKDWYNHQANAMSIILVDADTWEVRCMRLLGLSLDMVNHVKKALLRQPHFFERKQFYHRCIQIESKFTTENLIEASQMFLTQPNQ